MPQTAPEGPALARLGQDCALGANGVVRMGSETWD